MTVFDNIVVTHIDGVFTVPSHKGRFMEMEKRVDYGLSFCKNGQITYTQNGVKTVSDRYHAVILPQGAHYTLYGDQSGTFPLINFRTLTPFTHSFISIELENPEVYIKDTEKLLNAHTASDKAREFLLMYKILDRLKNEGTKKDFLAPVLKYMENNFSETGLSNALLARQLNISEVYFRKLFRDKYGTTPHKYLLNLRIEKAKQLLSDKGLSVTRIAEDCGFSGVYHFCSAFKEAVGLTPTGYRNELEKLKL